MKWMTSSLALSNSSRCLVWVRMVMVVCHLSSKYAAHKLLTGSVAMAAERGLLMAACGVRVGGSHGAGCGLSNSDIRQ